MNETIQPVHTSCKTCVFAIYNDITQYECSLNYLNTYKDQGVQILEAYDEEKEFYVINNKKCLGYREPKWFDQFEEDHTTLEQKKDIYFKHNQLNYLVAINLQNISIEELDLILLDIISADVQPQKIIFVRYRDESLRFSYGSIENLIKKYNINCSWRIQTMLESETEFPEVLHHISMSNMKYRFIMSIDGMSKIKPKSIINLANTKIHKELGQFLILSSEDKKCKIYTGALYRFGVANGTDIFDEPNNYTIV